MEPPVNLQAHDRIRAIGALIARRISSARPNRGREVIYRHTILVRLTHWLNALIIVLLVGTGLSIFNAHPQLYWGVAGRRLRSSPLLSIHAAIVGQVRARRHAHRRPEFDSTGVLGWSKVHGEWADARLAVMDHPSEFPGPGRRASLALPAGLDPSPNGVVYLVWSLGTRHLQRDLWPTWTDLEIHTEIDPRPHSS